MINIEQIREYYNHRKNFFAPTFDQLTDKQIKKINKSFGFKMWKLTSHKTAMVNVIQKPARY